MTPTLALLTHAPQRVRRISVIALVAMIAVLAVSLLVTRPAGAAIFSAGTPAGGLAAVNTCDPNFPNRAVFSDIKMTPSNGLASQYVTARIAVRISGTTTWYWGPWATTAVATSTRVASLKGSAATGTLSFNRFQYWDVQVQGAWWVNGAWTYATGTAKQALPSGFATATPFKQRSTAGGWYWSANCFS